MTENWQLNSRTYNATYGSPEDFGLQTQRAPFLRRQIVAEVVREQSNEVLAFYVNFTGPPRLEMEYFSNKVGQVLEGMHLQKVAKYKIQRFLIGDRVGWQEEKGIWILGIEASKTSGMSTEDSLGGKEMQIEWSQVVEGKQPDGTYSVSEVGQILVSETEFEMAQKLGGNPLVELVDRTAASSYIPQYVVSRFIPRSADSQRIARQDADRLLALRQVFDATKGSTQESIEWTAICQQNNWTEEQGSNVLFFLEDRGLIELRTLGPTVGLTRRGADEIENAIRNPRNRTHFFTANAVQLVMDNSINISGGNIGALHTGANAQSNVQQNIGVNGQELLQIFAQMRHEIQRLPDAERADASEYLDDLEAEAQSAEPKASRLKAYGSAFMALASGVLSDVAKEYLKHQLGVPS